ncbi:MAG TPA: hypothetical protein PLC89_28480 [Haliscomenobacter sp.]|uniref:hypothetical protein n=1 Tax=Haliscomenobacter sp. TaxID=2717303 RepID=UPI002D199BA3|nr:hypothetical protein [Haliscomenobacter sp.]HOY21284.1 hypothetical protein [Haliscomenobacter sp.]HPH20756.1 hypothetical protein [Haliscomenobacter sp.]
MKKHLFSVPRLVLLGVLFALLACDSSIHSETDNPDLLRQALELERRHCQLQASIDSLWDTTSDQLATAMPAEFPAIDRAIFLKARNADHMRMFMSFKQLDHKSQTLVNKAGEYDKILAEKVHILLAERRIFERQKNQFLQQLAQKDLAESRNFAQKIRRASTQVCL